MVGGATPQLSATEIFMEAFPQLLALGMSAHEFWDEDCQLVKSYKEAHKIRQQIENQNMWLQGAYVYQAILNVTPVMHAFAKRGSKAIPYPEEPFPITKDDLARAEEREREKKKAEIQARISAWAATVNQQMANKSQ